MIFVNQDHFDCAAYRSNRSYSNGRELRVDRLEKAVLNSLKATLLTDDHFAAFADEYR